MSQNSQEWPGVCLQRQRRSVFICLGGSPPACRSWIWLWSVASLGDVTADGIPTLVVGAPIQSVDEFHGQGEVFLYNGRDGRHLITFYDPHPYQGAMFRYTVASPGDTNGDAIPEFVFGCLSKE